MCKWIVNLQPFSSLRARHTQKMPCRLINLFSNRIFQGGSEFQLRTNIVWHGKTNDGIRYSVCTPGKCHQPFITHSPRDIASPYIPCMVPCIFDRHLCVSFVARNLQTIMRDKENIYVMYVLCFRLTRVGFNSTGFPLRLENLDNGKAFSSQGKVGILNRLEKSGKITQNTGEIRKLQIVWYFSDIWIDCAL